MIKQNRAIQAEISGTENVRNYAKHDEMFSGLMFRTILKDMKRFNIRGNCLEAGAGPGILSVMAARQNPDITVTAFDLSPDMAEAARDRIRQIGLDDRIRFLEGDAADEAFYRDLGKFEFVFSTFSMHHWVEPEKSLRNLWKAVDEGGILYIHDFRRNALLTWPPVKGGLIDSIRAAATPGEMKDLCLKFGILDFTVRCNFPWLLQTLIARK